jgi:hypothetical protein
MIIASRMIISICLIPTHIYTNDYALFLFTSYLIDNGIVYLILTDKGYPKRLAFLFLEEMAKEFEAGTVMGVYIMFMSLRMYVYMHIFVYLEDISYIEITINYVHKLQLYLNMFSHNRSKG